MDDDIDIMNDNYFVIAPPTTYKLLNKTIAEYKFIGGKIDRYSDKKVVVTKVSKPKNSTNKTVEIIDITLTPKQQNLLKYINILNENYYDNYQNWVKVGMLC